MYSQVLPYESEMSKEKDALLAEADHGSYKELFVKFLVFEDEVKEGKPYDG